MGILRFAFFCLLLAFASGCSFLPSAGPAGITVLAGGGEDDLPAGYALVDVSPAVVSALKGHPEPSFTSLSEYTPASAPVIANRRRHPGYGLGGGARQSFHYVDKQCDQHRLRRRYHNPRPGGAERTGTINVPFAGDIKVLGRTSRDVEKAIVKQLSTKAVDPQALVNVVRSIDNSVTVAGDAVVGGQVQLGPNNERVFEAVAVTGGIKAPVYDTFVSLTRGSRVITIPYLTLASNPRRTSSLVRTMCSCFMRTKEPIRFLVRPSIAPKCRLTHQL